MKNELEKHNAHINNMYKFYGYGIWGIYSKKDGRLIGRCGLQNSMIENNAEIELGYFIDYDEWNKGYASEAAQYVIDYAFHTLEIKRIVALIDKHNSRSIKIASKVGMYYKKEIRHNNRDCYMYIIEKMD